MIPTPQQILDSENYARKRMCTAIPSSIKPGLTYWDDIKNSCRITTAGCNASSQNPLSRPVVSVNNGQMINLFETEKNQTILDFWDKGNKWVPDQYVMKKITGSGSAVCARANTLLYQWCNYPETRLTGENSGPGYTDVPAFTYAVRDGKEDCIIGKDYCDNRGVSYDGTPGKEDCYVPTGQKIAEFLASSVLVRYAERSAK